MAGYIWSHVLLASSKTVLDAGKILVSANAGPSPLAGKNCHKNFFNISWQNDQTPMAMGEVLNQKGVKSLYVMAPNYAAGKNMVAGVERTFKGDIVGKDMTKWPDQIDWSAEMSKAKAANPDGVFIFYPGKHSSGLRISITPPTRNLSTASRPSTASTRVSMRLKATTRSTSSQLPSSQWVATCPRQTICAPLLKQQTSRQFAATSKWVPTTFRFRIFTAGKLLPMLTASGPHPFVTLFWLTTRTPTLQTAKCKQPTDSSQVLIQALTKTGMASSPFF